jgi:hypothetical protein
MLPSKALLAHFKADSRLLLLALAALLPLFFPFFPAAAVAVAAVASEAEALPAPLALPLPAFADELLVATAAAAFVPTFSRLRLCVGEALETTEAAPASAIFH